MGLGIRGAAILGSAVVEAATGTMPTSPAGLIQSVLRTGIGSFRFTLVQQVSILETDVNPVTIGASGAQASWSPVNPTSDGDFTQFDVNTHLSGAPVDVDFSVDLVRARVASSGQTWTPTPVGSGSGIVQAGQEYWQRVGDLNTARAWHCFIALPRTAARPQGGAMVLGGSSSPTKNGAGALNSTEIFDPVTGTWSPGPNLPEPRIQGKCIPFRGGKAVLLGGMSNQTFTFASALQTSYVVDLLPAVPTFTPVGGGGNIPAANNFRPGALACMDVGIPAISVVGGAHDGDPMVIGGMGFEDPDTTFYRLGGTLSAIRFDVPTLTWVACAPMSRVRGFAAIAPLGGGKILVAGGISYPANSGTPFDPATVGPPGAETSGWTDECEVYDADLDAWFPVDPLPAIAGEIVGAYAIAAPGGAFSTGRRVAGLPFNFGEGRAVIVGGLGPVDEASGVVSRPRASVLMFDINRAPGDQWIVLPPVPSGHAAGVTLRTRDGHGFAAIGVDELWSPGSAVTNILDPNTLTWRQGPDAPTNDPATAGPPPFLAPRLDPIFTGAMLHHGVQMLDAQERILVAGSHAHMGPAYLFPAIFFGAGTAALRVSGIFTPGGIPNPGTPPGAPVSPAGDDADLAAFQAFPFSAT